MVDHRVETTDDLRECNVSTELTNAAHESTPTSAHRAALVAVGRRLWLSTEPGEHPRDHRRGRVGFRQPLANHFESKDELFDEAVASALDAWGALRT